MGYWSLDYRSWDIGHWMVVDPTVVYRSWDIGHWMGHGISVVDLMVVYWSWDWIMVVDPMVVYECLIEELTISHLMKVL
jgi:peroxiredoxin